MIRRSRTYKQHHRLYIITAMQMKSVLLAIIFYAMFAKSITPLIPLEDSTVNVIIRCGGETTNENAFILRF